MIKNHIFFYLIDMVNINIIYKNNKSTYFEDKVKSLAESYQGILIRDFEHNSGSFNSEFSFENEDQEKSFKKEVINLSKYLNIEAEIGGVSYLD